VAGSGGTSASLPRLTSLSYCGQPAHRALLLPRPPPSSAPKPLRSYRDQDSAPSTAHNPACLPTARNARRGGNHHKNPFIRSPSADDFSNTEITKQTPISNLRALKKMPENAEKSRQILPRTMRPASAPCSLHFALCSLLSVSRQALVHLSQRPACHSSSSAATSRRRAGSFVSARPQTSQSSTSA